MNPPFLPVGLTVAKMSILARVRSDELSSMICQLKVVNKSTYEDTETYQINQGEDGIFALSTTNSEDHDHCASQCPQCQCIILVLSLPEGEVEHQSDHLVP